MMNYMTMMPNYYCFAPLQTSSYVPIPSQKENKPFSQVLLIKTIAQALSTSLKNYQQQLNHNAQAVLKTQIQALSANKKLKNTEKVIEIIISEEEEDGENMKANMIQQTPKTLIKVAVSAEKVISTTLQLPTDDENLNESKETLNKKDNESKKKNRKNRCENNLEVCQVKVPEIDLIDTAYLSQTEFSYESLAKKKQQLMSRKVGDWSEFIKAKKQRREIRMLGN